MHFLLPKVSYVSLNWGRVQQAWKEKSYWLTESRVELTSSHKMMLGWNCVNHIFNRNHAVFILSHRSPITTFLYLTLISANSPTPESAQHRTFYATKDGLGLEQLCYTEDV